MGNVKIIILSDGPCEAAEYIVRTSFDRFKVDSDVRSYCHVQTKEEVQEILNSIEQEYAEPILYSTIADPSLISYIRTYCDHHGLSYVDLMTPSMLTILKTLRSEEGLRRNTADWIDDPFYRRLDALEFATRFDDGRDASGLRLADIALLGISRTTKTPLSMYLANLNYRVINIPLIPEAELPKELYEMNSHRLFGLTNTLENLRKIRMKRLKSLGLPETAEYASEERIQEEMDYAHRVMQNLGCTIIDVSSMSIEETADVIIRHLEKKL